MEDVKNNDNFVPSEEEMVVDEMDNIENIVQEENTEKTEELDSVIKDLSSKIDELSKLFTKKIMYTEYQEKIVDQMHEELERYKLDMYAKLIRPILLDIIATRDSIQRVTMSYKNKPEDEQNIALNIFSDYSYDLQDILEKNEVEIYKTTEGGKYIPALHHIVKKIPTNDLEQHGTIIESFADGYKYNGKVLSAEKVSVYVYEKEQNESEEK